jgi:hypothetical protein
MWHWANIRSAVNATIATLLLAHIAVACWILVRHRTNIRASEPILLRNFVSAIVRRIIVRHRTNIGTGEHLLLPAALLLARIVIVALCRMNVGP